MSNHPLNLALRFLLELLALTIFFVWGWHHEGIWKYLLSFGSVLLAASVWGIFRVPNDPGKATVPVHGLVRLTIELLFFASAVWALFWLNHFDMGWSLLIILVLHYAFSYDRTNKLLHNSPMR
jgi:hypothetical protein